MRVRDLLYDQVATERFGLSLGSGVASKLALAMGPSGKHGPEVPSHNASLPIKLVEAALNAMAERTMATKAAKAVRAASKVVGAAARAKAALMAKAALGADATADQVEASAEEAAVLEAEEVKEVEEEQEAGLATLLAEDFGL